MEAKLKICSYCQKLCKLWKSNPAGCKSCCAKQDAIKRSQESSSKPTYNHTTLKQSDGVAKPFKVYRTTEIKKELTYYQKQLKIYKIVGKQFIKDHPICQAQIEGCLGKSDQVHHTRGRNGYLNDTTTFLACCGPCHQHIELNVEWSKAKGFIQSRLSKAI